MYLQPGIDADILSTILVMHEWMLSQGTFSWWDSIALITGVFTFYFSNNYQILFLYSKGMSTRDI